MSDDRASSDAAPAGADAGSSNEGSSNETASNKNPSPGNGASANASPEGAPGEGRGPSEAKHRNFGTFGGVFTPTVLTILGVIMYLRTGWVVGNAGILGGLLIILISFGIATLTALSMASITTNIRIGAGGAYAIICQSLGLEVGGAVGIPRYLSQALAVTMYIFGFREGFLAFFPGYAAYGFAIDVAVLAVLFGIAYVSADLAIKTEYFIMALIVGSLISVALAAVNGSMQYPVTQVGWWGDFAGYTGSTGSGAAGGGSPGGGGGASFWLVFAVFFPASTGIMAGANMSGDLENPRRSIPKGTMWALGASLVVYLALAYWVARSATPAELTGNYQVMIEKAFWSPIVVAGLLGACFSSALASAVGAGRILQAMGEHHIVPASGWVKQLTKKGEPRNAMLVTGAIVFAAILLRDLNALAPLITLFFLITYLMLNVVLLIEQSVNLVSFRPLWRVPMWVSVTGTLSCLVVMFIVNPTFSVVSVVVTIAFYALLVRRHLNAPFEDVRSGLFVSMAEWAAQRVQELPEMQERAWKPNLLVPVRDESVLRGISTILQGLTAPNGSVKIVGLGHNEDEQILSDELHSAGGGAQTADASEETTTSDEANVAAGAGSSGAGSSGAASSDATEAVPAAKGGSETRAARRGAGSSPRSRRKAKDAASENRPASGEPSDEERGRTTKRRQNVLLSERLTALTHSFQERGIFATSTVIDAGSYAEGLIAGMQAMRGTFFKPNVVFLEMPEAAAATSTERRAEDLRLITREADREGIGTLLYAPHPQASLGQRQSINVWIHDRSPDWRIKMKIGNLDLMVLSAYKLAQNWNARLRLITVVDSDEKEDKARDFMEQLRDLGRFTDAEVCVGRGSFSDYLAQAPQADLSVFGMLPEPDFAFCRRMVESTRSTCLFVRDSGQESALA